jgi:hypothetical protein
MEVVQITSAYFCAAIVVSNGKVIDAAPILKYMIGWSFTKVEQYAAVKRWEYNFLKHKL